MQRTYEIGMEKEELIELQVSGMHCNNCALSVHKLLEKKGLKEIYVDFANDEVKFKTNHPSETPLIISDIEGLGYKVSEESIPILEKFHEKVENKFYFSLIFTIPLFSHMFLPFHWLHNPLVQLSLCIPVYILGCIHFGKSAFNSLRNGIPNMDVLIFIGSSAAFIYSLYGTIQNLGPDYLFYETAATIISLVLLGNVLEKRSVSQTTSAVKDLMKFQEAKANKLVNGEIQIINSQEVVTGDTLVINSGDKIPVDGEIIWGEASVNESMLTGESLPVEKSKYDQVIGGTLIEKGSIHILVTKTGKHTILSQIIDLMKKAQSAKPPIQKLGDQVAAIFVPVVVGIAVLTFVLAYYSFDLTFQKSMLNAIAVLVISCPCAMGLATPTAVMVGLGRAAKNGILIKGGNTLEEIARLKYMVFDKTGTLTTGKFKIKKIDSISIPQKRAESIIYGIEAYSNHPIARSLVSELSAENPEKIIFTKVSEEKGLGMNGTDSEGNTYQFGSRQILNPEEEQGDFSLFLKMNGTLLARISIEDEIKPEASGLIKTLKSMGIKPILLSGDLKKKCEDLAAILGIEEIYAETQPHQKLEIIEVIKKRGKTAMVGDGINDAPALTTSDVGISMSDSSQIAIQSAEVVLLKNELGVIDHMLRIGKHTLLTIKQNLFWAFFYNVVAIPVAAFGFLNPMVGALTMAFSDVIVIGNSIRLKTKSL
ncbi:MAG: cation-translocating P-type ATPase [Daejeonella sp.]|uniref:heavy metal translocating P-type ATPase n=1 Tax=Daejeonella sp. TaxID=2805397 RepID=UPI0027371C16|nr:cation-translocating P-type ATPase [Daejeonella sp.]MDP3469940.1 cation-translocating P-type ATPase [Daejeonella sp.]